MLWGSLALAALGAVSSVHAAGALSNIPEDMVDKVRWRSSTLHERVRYSDHRRGITSGRTRCTCPTWTATFRTDGMLLSEGSNVWNHSGLLAASFRLPSS